jgi:hypothetical protein
MRDSANELLEVGDVVSHSRDRRYPMLRQVIGFTENGARLSGEQVIVGNNGELRLGRDRQSASIVSSSHIVKVFNQSIKELF